MSSMTPRKQAGLIAGLALLAAAAAWFLLVSPKRSEAADLRAQVEQTTQEVDSARLAVRKKDTSSVAPLPRLKRAMPDQVDMAAVIRELNALGAQSGVEFASITPSPLVPGDGFRVLPLSVDFEGDFPRVTRLLRLMREQVAVRNGLLSANGRLFSVESLRLTSDDTAPGTLAANLTLDIFLYGQGAAAPAADAASDSGATG